MPAGNWISRYDGQTVGIFDLESASVLDSSNVARVFIPSIRITKSESSISKIELRYLLYNPATSPYEVVSDLTTFKKVVSSVFVEMTNYNTKRRETHMKVDTSTADSNGVYTIDSSSFNGTWTETVILNGGPLATGYEIFG